VKSSGKRSVGEIADGVCTALGADRAEALNLGSIDGLIVDLCTLKMFLGGQSPDVDLAIRYLENMKRPRADKQAEGRRARHAAEGARIATLKLDTRP
jgi:hypothetical protein